MPEDAAPPVSGIASDTRVFVEGFSRTMDKLQVVIVAVGGACWFALWMWS